MTSPRVLRTLSLEINYDDVLGVGSYGKVCKAKYGELPCAAKLLHDTLLESGDPGVFKYTEKFEQECEFLSMVRHPNIVQYLGTYRAPQSNRLALLMELMDGNLTTFLEQSFPHGPLPYHTQLNICHDVALALSYLHSNDIIHRDLSSNNVLLLGEGIRAKITDFGMSRLIDINPNFAQLTICPGATVYMPPEALTTPPLYSDKLDCFSLGVLTVQVLTRNYPTPGDANKYIEDPKYPTGRVLVQFPEIERRKRDVDLIDLSHPLLPVVHSCLHDRDTDRPSADEVFKRLATLKREKNYAQSLHEAQDTKLLVQSLRADLEKKDELIAQKDKRHEYECTKKDIAHQKKLEEKDRIIQQLLEEREQIEASGSFTTSDSFSSLPVSEDNNVSEEVIPLSWREVERAPAKISSGQGTSTSHGDIAYFSFGFDVYSFSEASKWIKLQSCRYRNFGMAVVDGKLSTIGGRNDNLYSSETNAVLSYSSGRWNETLPPMPTKRVQPSSAAIDTHLVVAGGYKGFFTGRKNVEVLNICTKQWSIVNSLPEPVVHPRMVSCGSILYLSDHNAMFSCSIEKLLTSPTPSPAGGDSTV